MYPPEDWVGTLRQALPQTLYRLQQEAKAITALRYLDYTAHLTRVYHQWQEQLASVQKPAKAEEGADLEFCELLPMAF